MRRPSLPAPARHAGLGLAVVALLAGLVACTGGSPDPAPTGTTPATTAPSATPSATPGGRWASYVALGDSYTAGPFIPEVRLDPVGCARSSSNYPAFLAEMLQVASYTDVSCAGAETADLSRRQPLPLGTNVRQLDAVRADTDLVTVGVGGNDFDVFSRLTGTCPQLASRDPEGAPCREAFEADGGPGVEEIMGRVSQRLQRALAEVARRAPEAEVVVVGYPRILPADGTCAELPFASGDYAWADGVERSLNDALADAARRQDATFVDTYAGSRGHDACADEAWVGGRTTDPERGLAYHPREDGMRAVAEEVARALTGADERAGDPFDSGAPTMSREEQRDLAQQLGGSPGTG